MFDHLYAALPAALAAQRTAASAAAGAGGGRWRRSRWSRPSTWRSRARWRDDAERRRARRGRRRRTAACSARRSGCSSASAPERVIDTPLAENADRRHGDRHGGGGLEAGRRDPVLGLRLSRASTRSSTTPARLRHRTRGRLTCPMVLRTPCGAGIHAPEHHSESPEAMFAHIPGMRVVIPSSPRAPTACCSPRSAIPIRWSSSSRRGSTALFKEEVADDGAGAAARRLLHAARRHATSRS